MSTLLMRVFLPGGNGESRGWGRGGVAAEYGVVSGGGEKIVRLWWRQLWARHWTTGETRGKAKNAKKAKKAGQKGQKAKRQKAKGRKSRNKEEAKSRQDLLVLDS